MYQLGLGSVGLVLSGRIGLLIHRIGQSIHVGNYEVSYVLNVGNCEGVLQYIQALIHQHISNHNYNLK